MLDMLVLLLLTKDVSVPNLNTDPFDPLFLWARMITSIITWKLKIESFKNIYRIHWNYYYGDQQGIGHIDKDENNFISILYNPHTTDGGTEILGKFYTLIKWVKQKYLKAIGITKEFVLNKIKLEHL
jgi:hypothetical protein